MKVNIIYPDTNEKRSAFEDKLASSISKVILININKLDRTDSYKEKLVDETIRFIKNLDSDKVSLTMLQDKVKDNKKIN